MCGEPENMYMPEAEVRKIIPACRPMGKTEGVDWSANGSSDGGRNKTFFFQLVDRAGAQRINDEGQKEPKEPAKDAAALGAVLGFGLCGLLVHEKSVAQKEGFNRKKVLADGHYERRKESYGISV